MLATKLPTWKVESSRDFDKYLNEQLKRLQQEYIDFYLLHTLDKESWPKLSALGVCEWAEKAVADGRIRYLGFSFHDDFPAFKKIVDAYNWTMCLIQYNYMDVENQAAVKDYNTRLPRARRMIMEPLLGGRLSTLPRPCRSWNRPAATVRSEMGVAVVESPEVSVVLKR